MGRVYCVTNNLNGKQYVGQTITQHSRHGHGHAIRAAYKKHGFNNFSYEVITDKIADDKTLDYVEQFWINVIGTLAPNGYNLEGGGKRGKYVYHAPQLGKPHSQETRIKMSESQRIHWSNNDAPMKGRKHSELTKAKMSAARTGRKQSDEERKMRSQAIKMWHQNRKEQL
jgi:group I intron endonuclease